MATSYLNLVNKVLDRLNEVPLSQDTWAQSRGLHSAAKSAVRDTVDQINSTYNLWPWNAAQHTMTLTPGISEYIWADNFNNADFETFNIRTYVTPSTSRDFRYLKFVDRDQWYKYGRTRDQAYPQFTTGGAPYYVFEAHGYGFGVNPIPDKAYELSYRYYKNADTLENWDDVCTIPSNFDYVIVAGALNHMKIFKADLESSQMMDAQFRNGLRDMQNTYGRRIEAVHDNRVMRRRY